MKKIKINDKHKKKIFTLVVIAVLLFVFVYSSFIAKKRLYEIKFVDGTNVIDVQYLKSGEKLTIPDPPEKAGLIFVGWYHNNTKIEEGTIIYTKMKIEAAWNLAPTTTAKKSKNKNR